MSKGQINFDGLLAQTRYVVLERDTWLLLVRKRDLTMSKIRASLPTSKGHLEHTEVPLLLIEKHNEAMVLEPDAGIPKLGRLQI